MTETTRRRLRTVREVLETAVLASVVAVALLGIAVQRWGLVTTELQAQAIEQLRQEQSKRLAPIEQSVSEHTQLLRYLACVDRRGPNAVARSECAADHLSESLMQILGVR